MPASWFSIRNSSADSLVIDLHDEIGAWGITAKDFAATLKAAGKPRAITLNVDCPGGDCNDGFTIYDSLIASGADITVNITGLAASMASVIMLAGNTIRIAENGRVMVHRVTGGAMGNADELDAAAKVIKQFEDRIVSLYMKRTKKDEAEIRDMMKAQLGTWFFGNEAVEAGFADEVIQGTKAKAFRGEWAAKFTYLPAALFDTRATNMENPAAPISESETVEAPAAPVEENTPAETPEVPVEAVPAPETAEAKGILARIAAAFSGDAAMKAELATARDALAAKDGEITSLKAELAIATAKAAQLDAVTAELKRIEAEQKTIAQAAAEVAASHGLRADQTGNLPPPSEGSGTLLDQFNNISDPAERQAFYAKHKDSIRTLVRK